MHIYVDPSNPADAELVEPDDFLAFDVVVKGAGDVSVALSWLGPVAVGAEHVFVEPEALMGLAGDRAGDPQWLSGLEKMTAYAAEHGWVDEDGRIRAHVISESDALGSRPDD